jgi:hypothetical protein
MPLPEDAIALVSRFCNERSIGDSRIDCRTRGSAITIVDRRPPSRLGPLLAEIDADPDGVFWG